MTTTLLTSWLKNGRRLLGGAVLGLTLTGSAFAQVTPLPGVPNYQHLFDSLGATESDFDTASQGSLASDFGPNPSGHGALGRVWDHSHDRHQTRKPVFDGSDLWREPADFNFDHGPVKPAEPTESEKVDMRLSARYGNPAVERFIKSMSANRFAELYMETSRLIDGRHIEPTTYQARVEQAVENLRHAVRNAEFRRVYGLNVSAAQEQAFLRELDGYLANQPVRSMNEALRVMSGVASIAGRTLQLSPNAVAAEFIYGATESLDKYSAFNPEAPSAMPSASTGLEDSVVGIGVEIKPHDDGVIVVKPLRGSPAARAGLQRGDVLTNINGRNLGGQSMDFAVDQIAGQMGTPVLMTILRDGRSMQVSVRRERVRVYSVSEVQMIDPDGKVGYIKLDKFAEATSQEMDEALWSLHRQGMQSLVIDLRGNPGGLLTTAIELSDKFLPTGTIVSTKGRTAADNTLEQATRPQTWKTPLVVLVDENSASASEIFAAAIQENGRGLIVGRTSYGKGTVQTHFPLRTITGNLKITTARFYSPTGRVMAGSGVTPDIAVRKMIDDQTVVPLYDDEDVRQALQAANGSDVRTLAANPGRNDLLSRR
ncbi:MAG: S41 family peptidase [Planctomycetaceae bacterium]